MVEPPPKHATPRGRPEEYQRVPEVAYQDPGDLAPEAEERRPEEVPDPERVREER